MLKDALRLLKPVDVDVDEVEVAVSEVVAVGQFGDDRANEVLDSDGVAGDGDRAEGFEVEQDAAGVAFAKGHQSRDDGGAGRGGDGKVGVVAEPPGPAAVESLPRAGGGGVGCVPQQFQSVSGGHFNCYRARTCVSGF